MMTSDGLHDAFLPRLSPDSSGQGGGLPPRDGSGEDTVGDSPDNAMNGMPDGPGAVGGLVAGGRVLDLDIRRELQDSYLTYALSTIMDRALPDVRDGLKPSQRRILWAMNDLNLRPGRKHIKSAKICGDTSGNYHPHGEGVIYPTLVNLAQRWRMRVPLVDPQGNFGSLDGDPPAAMRYTEARMTQAAADMLADVEFDTVDMQANYDERLMEPTVLPAKFPNLLINGGIGIAVGMATSLAPHNPTEVFDSIIRVLRRPEITLAELMQDVYDGAEGDANRTLIFRGIKGPDFPTGGTLLGKRGIVEAYATGRGKVSLRGVCRVEEMGNGRQQIIVDAIPYNIVQNNLVEQIVEAVKGEKIDDVSDVRNESGRDAQTRIVVELKKGADPRVVEKQLYEFTSLQDTFSIMNISLVNRQPRTLSLREMIDCYVDHRVEVIRRRTLHQLREAKKRAHVLEGMIHAVCDIDEVIAIIRSSSTREEAIQRLMARRYRIAPDHPHAKLLPERLLKRVRAADADGGVLLSRIQAETIGGMRLIQLVGLEIERLANDYRQVVSEMEGYERILADHQLVLDIIERDCREMRARYDSPRKTLIEDGDADVAIADLIPQEDVALTISRQGYVKRVPLATYRQQGRGGKGIRASEAKDDDFIEHMFVAGTHDDLLCFTTTGRVFKMKVYEIPEMSRTSRGRAMINLLDLRQGERTCAYLPVRGAGGFEEGGGYLTFVSRKGVVKRTPLKDYRNVNRAGIIAVGLRPGDELIDVVLTHGTDDIMLVTALGSAIRFPESDVRLMGRSAAGVKGITLAGASVDEGDDQGEGVEGGEAGDESSTLPEASDDADEVIGVVRIPMEKDPEDDKFTITAPTAIAAGLSLLTITENGYGKRTNVDEYRVQPENGKMRSQSRGGKGRADIRITARNGRAVAALGVTDAEGVVIISKGGQLVRLAAASISRYGRGTQGVRVVGLRGGDVVIAASAVPPDEAPEGTAEQRGAAPGTPADASPADTPPADGPDGAPSGDGTSEGDR
ncbi:MAG: DNA gyrase subunit A [Planctomycetota bacterium]|nr:DNA gyrase subunit A [Planctomycetota bacterium]